MIPPEDIPDPPASLELDRISVDTTLIRIHKTENGALWFGPKPGTAPLYRFDAPAGEFRVLYAATRLEGAFAETILRRGQLIVKRSFVDKHQWTEIRVLRELRLVKLYSEGLLPNNVDSKISGDTNYAISQGYAAKLYAHSDRPDGIVFRARHDDGELSYALFDRIGEPHLPLGNSRKFANERAITEALMRRYKASWDPDDPIPPLS